MAGPKRKVLLRLDDASLIGPASSLGGTGDRVVRLTADKVAELGRVSQADVDRLQRIIETLKSQGVRVPDPTPVPQLQPAPSKRPREEQYAAQPAAAAPGGQGVWVTKCMEVLAKVARALGDHKAPYWNPVNPTLLPNYYAIVTNPIFLGDVEEKLKQGRYRYPQEFAADVRLHWNNVKLFNPKGDFYRSLGDKVESQFEEWWAATGYSTDRNKRVTAGLAAPKFDPERFDAPAKPKAARSQGGGGQRRPGGPRVNGGPRPDAPLSEERKAQMAAFLQELPEEHNETFMGLLPAELLAGMESGELELDFENLDQVTLKKIDAWLREIRPDLDAELPPGAGGMMGSPTHVSNNPSVRVDSFDDDEDYAGETEEESD